MTRHKRAPQFTCGALLLVALVLVTLLAGCSGVLQMSQRGGSGGGEEADGHAEISSQGEGTHGLDVQSAYGGAPAGDVPFIRVGLAHGVRDASVTGSGGFTVSLYADSLESWAARGGQKWRFGAAGGGITGSGAGGGFHMEVGTIRVKPEAGGLLVFGDVAYRGEIELLPAGAGSLTVVNVVDVESYLRGVVPREIGRRPESELEAIKAQAVAARTYALASSGRHASGSFDVFATVEDQVYEGADGEDAVCDRAILETAGIFMTQAGEPIHAYFHSSCGGRTEARHEVWELPRLSYLTQVWDSRNEDQFNDAFCSGGNNFRWAETWDGDEIARLVREYLPRTASTPVRGAPGDVKDVRVTVRTPSGRVRWFEVETDGGTYRVFGDRVRWLLRRPGSGRILRSSFFEVDVTKRGGRVTGLTVEGRGYGHGIGMCQHGAMEMARQGYDYEEILRHYYASIGLTRAYGETP